MVTIKTIKILLMPLEWIFTCYIQQAKKINFLQYSQENVCAAKHLKACNVIRKGSNTAGLLNAYCEIFESTYFDANDCLWSNYNVSEWSDTLKILQQMLFFVWPLILSTWKKVAKTRFRKLCAVHTQGTFNDCETVRKLEHLIEKFIKIFMVLLFGKM